MTYINVTDHMYFAMDIILNVIPDLYVNLSLHLYIEGKVQYPIYDFYAERVCFTVDQVHY